MNRVLYREWFPQIMYNHHQTGPAGTVMFAPPFRDPFNYNFDPLVPVELDLVGAAMHSRFAAEGKPGVTSRTGSSYSTWWNGGLRTTAYFHNMIGLLTETIGNPTPMTIPFVAAASSCPTRTCHFPIAPQRLALPAVDRLLGDREPRGARHRVAQPGELPLQHLPDGEELDRARQPGHAGRRRRGESSPRRRRCAALAGAADAAADAPAGDEPGAGGGRGGRGGGATAEDFKKLLRDPGEPRSARLHPPVGSAGLPDRDEVRQRADQDRRRRCIARRRRSRSPARTIRPARTS